MEKEIIKTRVKLRLSGFGYEFVDADDALIDYVLYKIEQNILNFCNISEVPEELSGEWVDGVCSDFLKMKFSTGGLKNIGQIVKSISEGDTTISYSSTGTPEAQLLSCLNAMAVTPSNLVAFRKLRW